MNNLQKWVNILKSKLLTKRFTTFFFNLELLISLFNSNHIATSEFSSNYDYLYSILIKEEDRKNIMNILIINDEIV